MVVLSNQPAFTCSKSTMKTPQKYVKSVHSHSGGFLIEFKTDFTYCSHCC